MINGDDESRISGERPEGPLQETPNVLTPEDVGDVHDEPDEPRSSFALTPGLAMRLAAPLMAAVALVFVIAGEADDVDSDLQLHAPTEAFPGSRLPLRAMLYDELHGTEGPKLVTKDVKVVLRSEAGAQLAQTSLHAANGGVPDMEGALQLPAGFTGRARLSAQTSLHGSELRVETPIRIVPDARGLHREGRAMRQLQFFAEGPVRAEKGARPPSAMSTRVAGGACVPEEPCELLVYVGQPAASIDLETGPSVTVQKKPSSEPREQTGVVRFGIVTHGPEAQLVLRASRGGTLVATRSLRLPIVLGGVTPVLEPRVLQAQQAPELQMLGEASGCVMDLFALDTSTRLFWQKTASIAQCTKKAAWPFGPLGAGMFRVQLRRDAFSAGTAGVAAIHVRGANETPAQTLSSLALRIEALGTTDPLSTAVIANPETFAGDTFEATSRYLLALLESDLVVYPPVLTGHAENLERLRLSQMRVRAFALLALALGGVSLALTVAQRGLRASRRASSILIDAGQEEADQRRSRTRSLVAVIASALAMLLVFVAVGLYVAARGF